MKIKHSERLTKIAHKTAKHLVKELKNNPDNLNENFIGGYLDCFLNSVISSCVEIKNKRC